MTEPRDQYGRTWDGLNHPNGRKTHCKYGHELSGLNLYVTPKGFRRCRACNRRIMRERYWSNVEHERARKREAYKKNPEPKREYSRAYSRLTWKAKQAQRAKEIA